MPLRKKSRLLDQLIERLEQDPSKPPLQSMHMLGLIELLIEKVWALAKWILLLAGVITVLMIASTFQIQFRNQSIDKVQKSSDRAEQASHQAQIAAEAARQLLQTAIDGAQSQGQGSVDAIASINRIEQALCGGKCPVTPTTTTTTTTTPPGG